MRKEKKVESLDIIIKALTIRQIAGLFDADEDDILSMLFGGEVKAKPVNDSDGEFMRRLDKLCLFSCDMDLKAVIKKAMDGTPFDLMELWAAFEEVNRHILRLPQVIAFGEVAKEATAEIAVEFAASIKKDLKRLLPDLSDTGI